MKNKPSTTHKGMTDQDILDCFARCFDTTSEQSSVISGTILCCATLSPFISKQMLYDLFDYQTKKDVVYIYLNRLVAAGLLKRLDLSLNMTDTEFRSLCYLTKQGYNAIASSVSPSVSYHSKNGKRLLQTAVHDYGAGIAVLSFLKSPFKLNVEYEVVTRYSTGMASNKKALHSIRHDAIIEYGCSECRGKIYLEHDTGSEGLSEMWDKLPLYGNHDLMRNLNDMVLFSFRKKTPKRPACFSPAALKRLIAFMPDGVSIDKLDTHELTPALASVISSLSTYTPAFKNHWKAKELSAMLKRLEETTDHNLTRFYRNSQESFAISRRNALYSFALHAYHTKEADTYRCISQMLSGFRIITSNCLSLSEKIPYLWMQLYPDVTDWIRGVLNTYYGSANYTYAMHTYPDTNPGRIPLGLHNVFHSPKGDICIEYLSADISVPVRVAAILDGTYNPKAFALNCVLLVDRFSDAVDFSKGMNYTLVTKNIPYERMFISFLLRGGDHLFVVDSLGNEVRLEP